MEWNTCHSSQCKNGLEVRSNITSPSIHLVSTHVRDIISYYLIRAWCFLAVYCESSLLYTAADWAKSPPWIRRTTFNAGSNLSSIQLDLVSETRTAGGPQRDTEDEADTHENTSAEELKSCQWERCHQAERSDRQHHRPAKSSSNLLSLSESVGTTVGSELRTETSQLKQLLADIPGPVHIIDQPNGECEHVCQWGGRRRSNNRTQANMKMHLNIFMCSYMHTHTHRHSLQVTFPDPPFIKPSEGERGRRAREI